MIANDNIPTYNEATKNEYWEAHWKVGESVLGWKKAERARGETSLLKQILDGINVTTEEFPEYMTNTKSVTGSQSFFEKYSQGANAFVPLCGDSRVVSLLAELGFNVLGCDLAESALKNIINELNSEGNGQEYEWQNVSKEDCQKRGCTSGFLGMNKLRKNIVELYAGDFFKIVLPSSSEQEKKFDLIYDRGSLVALLPELRNKYLEKIRPAVRGSSADEAHKKLFQNVAKDEDKKTKTIASLWLFVRAVHNKKTRESGPPFHFDVEEDIKGKYFKVGDGFEMVRPVDKPTEEQVENAPNGAFVEALTQIYRLA